MLTPRLAHLALIFLMLFAEGAFADSFSQVIVDCGTTSVTNGSPNSISYSWTFPQGNGTVSVVGASFGNPASAGKGPSHGAAATMTLSGVTLGSGSACLYQTGNTISQAWQGINLSNPQATGTANAQARFSIQAEYQINPKVGFSLDWHAGSQFTVLSGAFSQDDSFGVDGSGAIVKTPALGALTVTNKSTLTGIDILVSGSYTVPLTLGVGTTNMIQTYVGNVNLVLNSGTSDAVFSGSAEAGSGTTYSYDIVSLDPNVVFTPVPEPATSLLVGGGVLVLAVAKARRQRA